MVLQNYPFLVNDNPFNICTDQSCPENSWIISKPLVILFHDKYNTAQEIICVTYKKLNWRDSDAPMNLYMWDNSMDFTYTLNLTYFHWILNIFLLLVSDYTWLTWLKPSTPSLGCMMASVSQRLAMPSYLPIKVSVAVRLDTVRPSLSWSSPWAFAMYISVEKAVGYLFGFILLICPNNFNLLFNIFFFTTTTCREGIHHICEGQQVTWHGEGARGIWAECTGPREDQGNLPAVLDREQLYDAIEVAPSRVPQKNSTPLPSPGLCGSPPPVPPVSVFVCRTVLWLSTLIIKACSDVMRKKCIE